MVDSPAGHQHTKAFAIRRNMTKFVHERAKKLPEMTYPSDSKRSHPRIGEIMRFGIVGVMAMAIHYGIYYLFSMLTDLNVAFTAGYAVSFIFNFFASSYFTFKVAPSWSRLLKFGTSHGLNYLLQMAVFNLALYLGVKAELAPAIVYAVSVPASFLMVRFAMKNRLGHVSPKF